MIPVMYRQPILDTLMDWRLRMQGKGVSEPECRDILAEVIVAAIPRFSPQVTAGLTPDLARLASLALCNTLLDELYGAPATEPAPSVVAPSCGCNLALPVIDPPAPYTAAWLKARGNSEECPVYDGYDVRYAVVVPSRSETLLIASPFKGQMVFGANTMTLKCCTHNGCRWHIAGWAIGRPSWNSRDWQSGNVAPLRRTNVFFKAEVRRA